jgi:hypothetical protein
LYRGKDRHAQGYSAAMNIEESRILLVSIFHPLHFNSNILEFSVVLIDLTTRADEVDSQLRQAIISFSG